MNTRSKWDTIAQYALWPMAILLIIHRSLIMMLNGNQTDDFTTVWNALMRFRDGVPVYNETYYFIDPHYLYSPGGTVLLSPITWVHSYSLARYLYVAANVICIIGAIALILRIVGQSRRTFVFPALLVAAFVTESVTNNLVFTNINGVLLLAESLFLLGILQRKWLLAGLAFGLAVTVKPIFFPLLFIPLVRITRGWITIVTGLIVPLAFNAIGFAIVPGSRDYLSRTIPYLGETRDFANSSIQGIGTYFGMSDMGITAWRAFFAACVFIAAVCLIKWAHSDEVMWALTTSGLLFTGVFLVSNLGQMYYSMLLFPLIATVFLRRSVMHNPVAWIAVYLFLSYNNWTIDRLGTSSSYPEMLRPTFGWALMIVVITAVSVAWAILPATNTDRDERKVKVDLAKSQAQGARGRHRRG